MSDTASSSSASFVDRFKLGINLGHGAFGVVRLAVDTESHDEKEYAIKIVSKRQLMRKAGFARRGPKAPVVRTPLDQVYAEIAILKKLDHPNIVKLYQVYDEEGQDELFLVFENLPGGVIIDVPTVNPLPERKAKKYFVHIFLGMEYLHHQKIIHRDIKPENVLLDEHDNAKLCDFGVSDEFNESDARISNTFGTPAFLAPELLTTRTEGQHSRGKPVDIWALGVTLYCMLFGNVPFSGDDRLKLYANISTSPLAPPVMPVTTKPAKDMLNKLLCKDPNERLTEAGIRQHEWFQSFGSVPSKETNCGSKFDITRDDIDNCTAPIPHISMATLMNIKLKLMRKSTTLRNSRSAIQVKDVRNQPNQDKV